jgi:hypothetical protein
MADLELSLEDDLTRLARVAQDEDIYGKDLSPFRQRAPQIVLNLIGRIKERDALLKEAGEALEGVTQSLQVFVRESNDPGTETLGVLYVARALLGKLEAHAAR